ncbi:hypothetical protein [Variovorax sp. GrIS 2.14]|uniref:hypothetical protein n=1 Tax=Variovorax sp. GrIS 2.14 TaxID=3071709 RepID=UPI0038F71CBB
MWLQFATCWLIFSHRSEQRFLRGGYQRLLADHVAQLSALQQLLYAANSHAVLLIFQAMDASGKDGAIKHVMSGVNPDKCRCPSRSCQARTARSYCSPCLRLCRHPRIAPLF